MIKYTTISGATYTVHDGWTEYKGGAGRFSIHGTPIAIDRKAFDVNIAYVNSKEFWALVHEQVAQNNPPEIGKALFVQTTETYRLSTEVVSIEEIEDDNDQAV